MALYEGKPPDGNIGWGKEVRIMLEEDGYFDESGFRYIDGRQKEFILIPRNLPPNRN